MKRFGRARLRVQRLRRRGWCSACRRRGAGETSSETQPSTPSVRSWMGRKRSAACVRSSSASSKNSASPDLPASIKRRIDVVVVGAALDRVVEDGRVRGQARDRQLVDVARERAAGEELARDVVEPEALAELVELLCRLSWLLLITRQIADADGLSQWPMPAISCFGLGRSPGAGLVLVDAAWRRRGSGRRCARPPRPRPRARTAWRRRARRRPAAARTAPCRRRSWSCLAISST